MEGMKKQIHKFFNRRASPFYGYINIKLLYTVPHLLRLGKYFMEMKFSN